ncbi:MAG: RNA polymerase sigma factor RpoD/SigA [Treponema sp.]|nr:RNA polymerase sigma factor RpoD/SigA [Treponema sp.]
MNKMNDYYYRDISKVPLLTLEEEKALATKAFSGDKAAQDKLVEANLRFVVSIASKYAGVMELDDLIDEGNLGLMHAAEKYDPSSKARFATYAAWWIKAYIQKAIRETSTGVKFPSNKYEEMKKTQWKFLSLDKVISSSDDSTTTLSDFVFDDKVVDAEEEYCKKALVSDLWSSLDILDSRSRTVIIKRYGLDGNKPMSLSQLGELMGLTRESIRQIEKKALAELKNNTDLHEYLDLAA